MVDQPTLVPHFTTSGLLQLTSEATPLCYLYLGHIRKASSSLSEIVQTIAEEFRACHEVVLAIGGFATANLNFKKALGKLPVQVNKCIVDLQEFISKLKKGTRRFDWRNVWKSVEGWKELLLDVHVALEKAAKEALQKPKAKADNRGADCRSEVIESHYKRRKAIQRLRIKIDVSGPQVIETQITGNRQLGFNSPEYPAVNLTKDPAECENGRQRILDWIYLEDYSKKHNMIRGKRYGDIGKWILTSPELLDWIKGKKNGGSRLLWGYGIPGSGKTFVSSIVVDYFLEAALISNYGVAYIYFDHKEQSLQDTTNVLASIVRQLLSQLPILPDEARELYEKRETPGYDKLYKIFLSATSSFTNTFIIFDALDECDQEEQSASLLSLLSMMARESNVFLTNRERPLEDIQKALGWAVQVELGAREEDIRRYIEYRVNDSSLANRFYGNEFYREKIISDIAECAKGMFLLVGFHIQHLCQQPTINQILQELKALKNALSYQSPLILAYDRIMVNLRTQSLEQRMLVLRVFTWLVRANRTLTFKELQHALSIKQDVYGLERGNLTFQQLQDAMSVQVGFEFNELDLPDQATILSLCSGLVTIDEKTSTAQLVHSTVKEYLINISVIQHSADSVLAIACASYLSSKAFSRGALIRQSEFEARTVAYPFLKYASEQFVPHLGKCDNALTTELLLSFLRKSGRLSSYLQALHSSQNQPVYPKNHLPLHFACSIGHLGVSRRILETGASIMARDSYGETAFSLAVANGRQELIHLLLDKGFAACKKSHHSTQEKHTESVQYLLETLEKSFNRSVQDSLNTALSPTTGSGHLERPFDCSAAVRDDSNIALSFSTRLNAVKATPNSGTELKDSEIYALYFAASGGYVEMLELLFNRFGGLCLKESGDWPMDTALANAAVAGHEKVVEMLLKRGISPSGKSEAGHLSPLCGAASKGHLSIVRLLLQHGATPAVSCPRCLRLLSEDITNENSEEVLKKVTGGFCKCPSDIREAASEGDFEKFRQMLDQGADVLSQDEGGCTALHWAARNGHESIIYFLLEMHPEIDVSVWNHKKQTVLHLAAVWGHQKIVSLLLDGVPGIGSVQDMGGFTALHLATLKGHDSVVSLLLLKDQNTDHSRVNRHQQTALHLASAEGHITTVQLLLENSSGIPFSATDENRYTALSWAVQGAHEEVVHLLLEKTKVEFMDRQDGNPLHLAAKHGHIGIASSLMQKTSGLFVQNSNGMTPLHIAAMKGHENMVRLLLEGVPEIRFSLKDDNGYTALHWAVQEGHGSVVRLILQQGPRIDLLAMTNRLQTVLHIAVLKGHEEITRLLLRKIPSTDLTIRNRRGYTALHLAVSWGHEAIVGLLAERYPEEHLSAKEHHGYTALHLAAIRGHEGMVRLLLQKTPEVDISVLTMGKCGEVMMVNDAEPREGHEVVAGLLLQSELVKNSRGLTARTLAALKRSFAADSEKRRELEASLTKQICQSVSDGYMYAPPPTPA